MLHPTVETFRKDLDLLSQRLQALRRELQERGLFSGAHKSVLDRIQTESEIVGGEALRRRAQPSQLGPDKGRVWSQHLELIRD